MSGVAAPLYAVPGAPWDGAGKRGGAEWVETADGARLRAALFPALGEPRGTAVVSPGRTEFIEKYAEVIGELQGRGFTVLVHDWRGHGLSAPFARLRPGPSGSMMTHARGWRLYLSDFSRLLDAFALRMPQPWIGLGHSMGGGLTLLAMSEGERRLDAAILSAPMLGLRLGGRPERLVRGAATLMSLLGRAGEATPPASRGAAVADAYSGETMTHDRKRWARFQALLARAPELRLGETTWGWVQFALTLTLRIQAMRRLETLDVPVVIVSAGRDRVVNSSAQRAAAGRLPRGRFVETPDAFHELLLESDERRAVFWRAFDDLTDEVCG